MKMSTAMTILGYGGSQFGQDLIKKEQAKETAISGQKAHKPGCSGYYDVSKCECRRPDWKALSASNYPRDPNPPMQERDAHDHL